MDEKSIHKAIDAIGRTDDKLGELQDLMQVVTIAFGTGEIVDKESLCAVMQGLRDLTENAQIILGEAADCCLLAVQKKTAA